MQLREIAPITDKILYYHPNQGALGLSDVILPPRHSDVSSRYQGDQIQTGTIIAKGLQPLNIPFISAGMDTVTGAQMAITFALQGGLGEVHRNNFPADQAQIIREVKDRLRVKEENPPRLPETATIADARQLLEKRKRGYVILYNSETGLMTGMATPRDFEAGTASDALSHVMTPMENIDYVNEGTNLGEAVEFMRLKRREKVPILDSQKRLIGMYSSKDAKLYRKNPNAVLDAQGRLMVGAAIGIKESDIDRAHQIVEAGADVIFVDVAHGDNENVRTTMRRLKIGDDRIDVPIILGNFAPYSDIPHPGENVLYAIDLGADGIKIGIGPGAVCTTRDQAGTGVPQLTAILNARRIMDQLEEPIPIIADGGVRIPHDAEVALAAGGDAVMIGTVFAGTSDSPGEIIDVEGKRYKEVRGMASADVFLDRLKMGEITTNAATYLPAAEGRKKLVPFRGNTRDTLNQFVGGLRSAMSYSDAHTIYELQQATLVRVTPSGAEEHRRE